MEVDRLYGKEGMGEEKRLGGISLGSRVQKSAKAKQDAGSYGF